MSSKRLTLSMFAVTVFSVSGAAGSLLTSHNPPVHFCLSGVLIVCCNAVTLALLLGPKVGVASHDSSSDHQARCQMFSESF